MPDYLRLAPLFAPSSVAVVGERDRISPASPACMALAGLLAAGYRGGVHAVNPAAGVGGGRMPELVPFAGAEELPDGVELAVLCLPRERLAAELELLDRRGVRAAVALASGPPDQGRRGFFSERELTRAAVDAGILLLGPDSLGLINTSSDIHIGFPAARPAKGGVSFFSQSGAMCACVLEQAAGLGLGFAKFVSLGGKALLGEADMLRALGDDPETTVILGYCESVENGEDFRTAARQAAAKKPVLLLKAGVTRAGARAVSAHMGLAAGSAAAFHAAFRQSGVIEVRETAELLSLARMFATQPMPSGPGLAVVTNAGGPGILAADACAEIGLLTLPRPGSATLERLSRALPGIASLYNPVDVLGDAGADRYEAALSALAADPQVASLLVLLAPTAAARPLETARAVIRVAREDNPGGKPFAACLLGGESMRAGRRALLEAGIPCYDFPEEAVAALSALCGHGEVPPPGLCEVPASGGENGAGPVDGCGAPWDDEALSIVESARGLGLGELCGVEALEAAHAAGLPVLSTGLARTSWEAARLADDMGYPVSLRLALRDAGPEAVPADDAARFARLADAADVRRAFAELTNRAARELPDAPALGCLVQAAAPETAFELSVGFVREAPFGPLVFFRMAGMGDVASGDATDAGDEAARRLAPLSPADARAMLREMRFYPLLRGACGGEAASLPALERLLLGVSRLAVRAPQLAGALFSPVFAGPRQARVAGARLALR